MLYSARSVSVTNLKFKLHQQYDNNSAFPGLQMFLQILATTGVWVAILIRGGGGGVGVVGCRCGHLIPIQASCPPTLLKALG